jgi:hypothetical protein
MGIGALKAALKVKRNKLKNGNGLWINCPV